LNVSWVATAVAWYVWCNSPLGATCFAETGSNACRCSCLLVVFCYHSRSIKVSLAGRQQLVAHNIAHTWGVSGTMLQYQATAHSSRHECGKSYPACMHRAAATAAAWCQNDIVTNIVWVLSPRGSVFSSSAPFCLVGVISASQGLLYLACCATAGPGSSAACRLAAKSCGGLQHLCNTLDPLTGACALEWFAWNAVHVRWPAREPAGADAS
jgi:hypothetical protein